ncbi:MAG: hypothetical protein WCD76_08495 [Pyrinomonadaceae bacterium]
MKKSDLKLLRERNQKAVQPSQPKKEDLSDELTNLFDDGTKLSDGALATSSPMTPVTSVTGVTPVPQDAAPKRDFARVANSVVRDAIPAGLFTGKGKQLYDYLYSHTRGSIVPKRSTRIPTDRVMKGAGMTRHTYRAHLQRLVSTGLIQVDEKPGEHGGNVFTVFLPEEIGVQRGHKGDRGHRGDTADSGQDLPLVQGSEVDRGDRGLSGEISTTSGELKTSFKTKDQITDDEPAALARVLGQAERDLTGKNSGSGDQWRELGEVLAAELKIAAGRTTVSSAPAFLAEHLRRRLWKLDKKQAQAEGRELPDQVAVAGTSKPRSDCPDCGGSGWWYPDGLDRGVMKCAHKNAPQPHQDVLPSR